MNSPIAKIHRTFILLSVFCIAMGFLESIVVVYLRQIYYPMGFEFPLKLFSPEMVLIEWIREIATIIMLVTIGILADKDNLRRFLYFLFSFAIWDLFYYVGLKLFLNWPSSLLTWDVLFLIPLPWISPVLAPVICSLTMIFFAVSMMYKADNSYKLVIRRNDWGLLILGSLIIFASFIQDYFILNLNNGLLLKLRGFPENKEFMQIISSYKPITYNWYLFILGEIIILWAIIRLIKQRKLKN